MCSRKISLWPHPGIYRKVPIVATLEELERSVLVEILKKPRNAISKQYKKLFRAGECESSPSGEGALRAIGGMRSRREGARGLRSIMEKVMLDVMYELPSITNVKECVVSEEVITSREKPILIYEEEAR